MNPGIFYLYEYNHTHKIRTVGFLKLTRYYHSCTLQLNARGIGVTRADTLKLCAFYLENNTVGSTVLADLPCANHMLNARLNFAECQFPDGHTLNTMDGFFLPLSGGRILAATVPGILVDADKLVSAFNRPAAHEEESDILNTEPYAAADANSDTENTADADNSFDSENTADTNTGPSSENTTAANTGPGSENTAFTEEQDAVPDSEEAPAPKRQGTYSETNSAPVLKIQDSDSETDSAPVLKMQDSDSETDSAPVLKMQDASSGTVQPDRMAAEAADAVQTAHIEEGSPADKKTSPDTSASLDKNPLPSIADASPEPEDITSGPGSAALNGDTTPAESSPETPKKTIRKIQRSDLAELPRHYWHLANNSFLLHGYHNYSHLLLVEEDGHHWLGVPGIYDSREARAARLFGFPQFTDSYNEQMELSGDEKNTQGTFGYWCCYLK